VLLYASWYLIRFGVLCSFVAPTNQPLQSHGNHIYTIRNYRVIFERHCLCNYCNPIWSQIAELLPLCPYIWKFHDLGCSPMISCANTFLFAVSCLTNVILKFQHFNIVTVIIIRLHRYHGEDYCFCQYYSFFFPNEVSGQTWNLHRYGPRVDLRTLTHFQRPWPTFQGHRPIFVSNPYNFIIYDRILMKLRRNGPSYDAMSMTLTYFFRSNLKSARNFVSPVWPNLDIVG